MLNIVATGFSRLQLKLVQDHYLPDRWEVRLTGRIQKQIMEIPENRLWNYINFIKAIIITQIVFWHFYGFSPVRSKPLSQLIGQVLTLTPSVSLNGLWLIFVYYGGIVSKIFFATSGFGLYLSYRRNPATWLNFFKKRAFRLLPLYWLALITYPIRVSDGSTVPLFIAYPTNELTASTMKSFVLHFFTLQTYTPYSLDFSQMWFIGMLSLFYLLFPGFVYCFSRRSLKCLFLVISLVVLPLAPWALNYFGVPFGDKLPRNYSYCFIFGMLLADVYITNKKITETLFSVKSALVATVIIVVTLALQYKDMIIVDLSDFQCFLWLIALYIPYTIARKNTYLIEFFRLVSYSSYAMYLFHLSFIVYILRYLARHKLTHRIGGLTAYQHAVSTQLIIIFTLSYFAMLAISLVVQKTYDRYIYVKLVPSRK